MNLRAFLNELKRRNVYKVAAAYAVVAWLLIQLASILFPTFEAPPWVLKVFVTIVALGFPLALIFAWAFELTPEGIKRTDEVAPERSIAGKTGRKLTMGLAALAAVALALLLFQLLRPKSAGDAGDKSIAVLPFASLSEDKANAYFADGIQDEILTRLSKIGDLKVISRTSTQQYQSKPPSVTEIGKQLGVAHVLEGNVQKAGDSVRVNVQLIKAEDDSHLWAETYTRKLTDIFALQSEVSQRIADSLEAKLTGREKEAIHYVGTQVTAAYDAYLRGIALRNSQAREEQDQLIRYCREAVALDPNYAAAWSELAVAEGLKFIQGERTEAQRAMVQQAAENALRLDPNHGDGHSAMGMYLYYCLQDYDGAIRELEQARQQAPNNALYLQATGLVKRRQGKLSESIDLQLQAARLDPRNQDIWVNIAWTYRGMRKFDEARTMFDRALAIAPHDISLKVRKAETDFAVGDVEKAARVYREAMPPLGSLGYPGYIAILVAQRRFDEAIAKISGDLQQVQKDSVPPFAVAAARLTLGQLQQLAGRSAEAQALLQEAEAELIKLRDEGNSSPNLRAALLTLYASLGQREEVARAAAVHIEQQAKDRWMGPYAEEDAARAFCILGECDRALPILERLLVQEYADALTPAFLRLDPIWDPVRSDPRFAKLAAGKP